MIYKRSFCKGLKKTLCNDEVENEPDRTRCFSDECVSHF